MHLNQYVFSILDDIAKDCFACPSIVSFANYPLMTLDVNCIGLMMMMM